MDLVTVVQISLPRDGRRKHLEAVAIVARSASVKLADIDAGGVV